MTSTPREDDSTFANLGERLFEWRDYTPIPLVLLVLVFADPSARSATLGTLLIALGELIRLYSVAFIGTVSRTRNVATTGMKLISDGPFALVRNPLYVGNALLTIGFAVYAGRIWLIVAAAAAFAFQYHCIVKFEERLLVQRFGHEYEDYRQRVPAWLPRRLPAAAEFPAPPDLAAALQSEKRTLLAAGAMLLALMLIG